MSFDLFVRAKRSAMPTAVGWAQAIRTNGFDADLDTEFDPHNMSGFLPCPFRKVLSGFEHYSRSLSDAERCNSEIPSEYDFNVTFSTGANLRELASALVAAGALCKITNGQLVDHNPANGMDPRQSLRWCMRSYRLLKMISIDVDEAAIICRPKFNSWGNFIATWRPCP